MHPKECFKLCDVCGMARTINRIQGLSEDEYNDRLDVADRCQWQVACVESAVLLVCCMLEHA